MAPTTTVGLAKITGGCINVDDATMATLLKSVKLGDEVVVSSDGPCNE